MDPFEVRLQFLSLLSRLTSSLASIQKVSSFALKHGPKCGDDIWDCLVEECGRVNLNARINLLYFLDTLLDKQVPGQPYKEFVRRDLAKLVEMVVPDTREGVLNLMSTNQVLRSWKTRRLLDSDVLDAISADLDGRRTSLHSSDPESSTFSNFSRNDILRRIEDDRERHKRLRERIWVLPVPTSLFPSSLHTSSTLTTTTNTSGTSSTKTSPASPASPSELSSSQALRTKPKSKPPQTVLPSVVAGAGRGPELAIEIEFEQLWEASEDEMVLARGGRGGRARGEDVEMEEGEEGEEQEVEMGNVWPLDDEDRMAMRTERERCFVDVR